MGRIRISDALEERYKQYISNNKENTLFTPLQGSNLCAAIDAENGDRFFYATTRDEQPIVMLIKNDGSTYTKTYPKGIVNFNDENCIFSKYDDSFITTYSDPEGEQTIHFVHDNNGNFKEKFTDAEYEEEYSRTPPSPDNKYTYDLDSPELETDPSDITIGFNGSSFSSGTGVAAIPTVVMRTIPMRHNETAGPASAVSSHTPTYRPPAANDIGQVALVGLAVCCLLGCIKRLCFDRPERAPAAEGAEDRRAVAHALGNAAGAGRHAAGVRRRRNRGAAEEAAVAR